MNSRESSGGHAGVLNNTFSKQHAEYMERRADQGKYSSTGIGPDDAAHAKRQEEYTSKFGREYMKNQAEAAHERKAQKLKMQHGAGRQDPTGTRPSLAERKEKKISK